MKKAIIFLILFLYLLTASGCAQTAVPAETVPAAPTEASSVPVTESSVMVTVPETTTAPEPVLILTEEEQTMLLKIGMAELGQEDCTECIALVMCTILNRVESGRFGSTIQSVLFAQDQFTPVSDGTYYNAEPTERCREALDMVICGWDESQGALYYEFCEGESWHSKNLNLLFQHCNTRFYD